MDTVTANKCTRAAVVADPVRHKPSTQRALSAGGPAARCTEHTRRKTVAFDSEQQWDQLVQTTQQFVSYSGSESMRLYQTHQSQMPCISSCRFRGHDIEKHHAGSPSSSNDIACCCWVATATQHCKTTLHNMINTSTCHHGGADSGMARYKVVQTGSQFS